MRLIVELLPALFIVTLTAPGLVLISKGGALAEGSLVVSGRAIDNLVRDLNTGFFSR